MMQGRYDLCRLENHGALGVISLNRYNVIL
jgi:hypothetical protein